jgi:hypothetical protein
MYIFVIWEKRNRDVSKRKMGETDKGLKKGRNKQLEKKKTTKNKYRKKKGKSKKISI